MELAGLITTSANYEADKNDVLGNTTPSQASDRGDLDEDCQNTEPNTPRDAEEAENHALVHENTSYDQQNPPPTTQTSSLVTANQL